MRGKLIHSNVSVYLHSEYNIIGWAFMHEVNISPPLSLARFFLTQQLIYKSKIEKHNVSLDIFVSDTSIDKNLHLPGLEKEHFSYVRTHTPFSESDFSICVAQNQRTLSGAHYRSKRISKLINDWENNISYRKNPNKSWKVRFVSYST